MPAAMEASVGPVATAVALVAVQTLGCVEEVKVDAAVKGVALKAAGADKEAALKAAAAASAQEKEAALAALAALREAVCHSMSGELARENSTVRLVSEAQPVRNRAKCTTMASHAEDGAGVGTSGGAGFSVADRVLASAEELHGPRPTSFLAATLKR